MRGLTRFFGRRCKFARARGAYGIKFSSPVWTIVERGIVAFASRNKQWCTSFKQFLFLLHAFAQASKKYHCSQPCSVTKGTVSAPEDCRGAVSSNAASCPRTEMHSISAPWQEARERVTNFVRHPPQPARMQGISCNYRISKILAYYRRRRRDVGAETRDARNDSASLLRPRHLGDRWNERDTGDRRAGK